MAATLRVFVLDGNENQAVACVRSLAAAGHDVHVGSDSRWSKAGWSRFCRGRATSSPSSRASIRVPHPSRRASWWTRRCAGSSRSAT